MTVPVQVELVTVLPGAAPFKFRNNVTDTYFGQAYRSDGSYVSVVLKDLSPMELANEAFAAILARELGLPVPTPFVAIADASVLTGKNFVNSNGRSYFFASERKGTPPLAHRLMFGAFMPAKVMNMLCAWVGIGKTVTFDTWIANQDRHMGNLLFDAGSGDVWLIDHGRSFTGTPHWSISSLIPLAVYKNRLTEWLCPAMSPTHRN